MTETDWLTSTDPRAMLHAVMETASDRKLRLFTVSLARELADPSFDAAIPEALDAADRKADGRLSPDDEGRLSDLTNAATGPLIAAFGLSVRDWPNAVREPRLLILAAILLPTTWLREPYGMKYLAFGRAGSERQPRLLREVLGNPVRPVTPDPSWLTPTVVALADGINQNRGFDRLPVLADALADAGCDHDGVLSHCRGPGPHARGCWVLDMVLGKG